MTSLSLRMWRMSGFSGDTSHHHEVGLQIGAEQEGLRPRRMEVPLLIEADRARVALPHAEPYGVLAAPRRFGERALHQRRADAGANRRLAGVQPRDLERVLGGDAGRVASLAYHDVADGVAVPLGEEHRVVRVLELRALDRFAERRRHVRGEVLRRIRL